MLDDVLPSGATIVFTGNAAGRRSAALGAYYAHKGNRFWKTLAEIGFTDRVLAPEEYRQLEFEFPGREMHFPSLPRSAWQLLSVPLKDF